MIGSTLSLRDPIFRGEVTFEAVVEAMTNRERCRWARAGYPGLMRKNVPKLLAHPDGRDAERRLKRRAER